MYVKPQVSQQLLKMIVCHYFIILHYNVWARKALSTSYVPYRTLTVLSIMPNGKAIDILRKFEMVFTLSVFCSKECPLHTISLYSSVTRLYDVEKGKYCQAESHKRTVARPC